MGVVIVPVVVVAAIVLAAAFVDERTRRIPNRLTLAGIGVVAISVPIVASIQSVATATVGGRVAVGVVLGGAPILFLLWLLDPSLIGGGDWKLLATSSAALGLVLPVLAVVGALAACLFQFVRFGILRERLAPFGPAVAAGMLISLALLPTISRLTGGQLA